MLKYECITVKYLDSNKFNDLHSYQALKIGVLGLVREWDDLWLGCGFQQTNSSVDISGGSATTSKSRQRLT